MENPQFEELQERAAKAVTEDELASVYVGLVHENGEQQYFFGNDTDGNEELQEMTVAQLGMLLRVLADRSNASIDEIADVAIEHAGQMQLQ
ncbi:hypothetical protein ZOD2009_14526 [Haladaptatus paucihalophilus DX253]|uniref:DUF8113 domain-containing protein n=1 Tax=Haladaptatus paucihalophilus DX253 TaxID=797209 RepID=E7QVR9_HALPU|nr:MULTISPECIES: hypothetical protein [Haladaptatus]EFW91332.1 hypothetical protein ZOD2009_14526 [Haladaptatus paucihalophilus DX253]GKZ14716.1 hypothetical protein HAL_25970 [Haladaptatus sp. T7]SHL11028.1 hypothetical protein SAMN05444342_3056 [Haladaptatus paucihalophilus DX253]